MVLFVLALKKPENKIINWSFIGSCGVITLLYLIVTIVDGSTLTKANEYCNKGMPEAAALFKPSLKANGTGGIGDFGIECFPNPYTGTMFSSIFVMIVFPGLASYYFFYQRRNHLHGEPSVPTDDETKPLATSAPVPAKKMFVASEINDESLTQDVTGANPFDPKTGMEDTSS